MWVLLERPYAGRSRREMGLRLSVQSDAGEGGTRRAPGPRRDSGRAATDVTAAPGAERREVEQVAGLDDPDRHVDVSGVLPPPDAAAGRHARVHLHPVDDVLDLV